MKKEVLHGAPNGGENLCITRAALRKKTFIAGRSCAGFARAGRCWLHKRDPSRELGEAESGVDRSRGLVDDVDGARDLVEIEPLGAFERGPPRKPRQPLGPHTGPDAPVHPPQAPPPGRRAQQQTAIGWALTRLWGAGLQLQALPVTPFSAYFATVWLRLV